MSERVSERTQSTRYRAALVRAALRADLDHDAGDADLARAAVEAGLRPPTQDASRAAVREALADPVDFNEGCNQDRADALFDAAENGCPLVVVGADGRRVVMVPLNVEEESE